MRLPFSPRPASDYLAGLDEGKKRGLIVQYGRRIGRPYGPPDEYGTLGYKNKYLLNANTRHIHETAALLLAHIRQHGDAARRVLFLGPGAGVELTDARKILQPETHPDTTVETITLTPVHPFASLRLRSSEIVSALKAMGHHPSVRPLIAPSQYPHRGITMEALWKIRHIIPGLFAEWDPGHPYPSRQHVGEFPKDFFAYREGNPLRSRRYTVFENLGPLYHAKDSPQTAREIYELLAPDGFFHCSSLGNTAKKTAAFREAAERGDVVVSSPREDLSEFLFARRFSPLAQHLTAAGFKMFPEETRVSDVHAAVRKALS